MSEDKYTLSEYERLALANIINLSDGHARHSLTEQQRAIVGRSLEFFDRSLSLKQRDVELEFLTYFFRCAAQGMRPEDANMYLNFSSSSAIKIGAQFCRMRGLAVFLIEPCFDNIVHMLKSEGVQVYPIHEDALGNLDGIAERLDANSAIWIVQPNNPTGFCLSRSAFINLIKVATARRATVIVDFCFRFYADCLQQWDQYSALNESRTSFLTFEDTGKTWPLSDTKVGITVCSADTAPIIYRLHDELLLNVSPFHLLLITEFIKHTLDKGFYNTIRQSVEHNRALIHTLVAKGLVEHASQWSYNVPMALLKLPRELHATRFWANLRRKGVDVLPAKNYFWSRSQDGESLLRIPLSRPKEDVETAIPLIEETLLSSLL